VCLVIGMVFFPISFILIHFAYSEIYSCDNNCKLPDEMSDLEDFDHVFDVVVYAIAHVVGAGVRLLHCSSYGNKPPSVPCRRFIVRKNTPSLEQEA
ncbi:hypothetical protein L9F63_004321, partial [Diploptera punctata]